MPMKLNNEFKLKLTLTGPTGLRFNRFQQKLLNYMDCATCIFPSYYYMKIVCGQNETKYWKMPWKCFRLFCILYMYCI